MCSTETRIENEIPNAVTPQDIIFLYIIGRKQEKQHMVFYEAYSSFVSTSFSLMSMTNMCFKVSFIDVNGNILDNSKNLYLIGQCLDVIFGMNTGLKNKTK